MGLLPCFIASYGADRPFLSGFVISQDMPNGSKVRGCLSCRKTPTVNTKTTFWPPEWLRTRDHGTKSEATSDDEADPAHPHRYRPTSDHDWPVHTIRHD